MNNLSAFLVAFFIHSIVYSQSPGIEYIVHIQSDGWSQGWVQDGNIAGRAERRASYELSIDNGDFPIKVLPSGDVVDDTKRIEGIKIKLKNAPGASVRYKAHVQSYGWQDWVRDGQLAGTEGQSKRLEAIIIELDNFPGYTVKYRVRFESENDLDKSLGQAFQDGQIPTVWSNWMNEGDVAGTVGEHRRLSHIMIAIGEDGTPKTSPTPISIAEKSKKEYKSYTIKESDWLSSISESELGSFKRYNEIYELNKDIFPGQIIKMPN